MEEMINEELLSEVLGEEVESFEFFENNCFINVTDMMSEYVTPNAKYDKRINMYELVHDKLKQWAYNKGYSIYSGIWASHGYVKVEKSGYKLFSTSLTHKSETEAILSACNWIFNNRS